MIYAHVTKSYNFYDIKCFCIGNTKNNLWINQTYCCLNYCTQYCTNILDTLVYLDNLVTVTLDTCVTLVTQDTLVSVEALRYKRHHSWE